MGPRAVRLRVHFAPVGFQVERLIRPALSMKADAVLLITQSRTDEVRDALARDIDLLKKHRIDHHLIECNVWDSAVVTSEVGTVVTAEPQHEYFFNASTGPRTAAIGGIMAAMFWRIQPYYVRVDAQTSPVGGRDDFPVTGDSTFLPTFETPALEPSTVEALEYVATRGAPISKKELMDHLKQVGTLRPRASRVVTPQAFHAQTDVILQKLEGWGFIEKNGRGKNLQLEVTSMGRAGSKMFHHVLNPRPAPEILRS